MLECSGTAAGRIAKATLSPCLDALGPPLGYGLPVRLGFAPSREAFSGVAAAAEVVCGATSSFANIEGRCVRVQIREAPVVA